MSAPLIKIPNLKDGQVHRTELIIKKSRFITSLGHTAGVEQCKEFIARISSEFADARHNCFAYNGGAPNESGFAGCSDDGEPHGTAGHPMLNVLLHCGIGELTCVVTRYFGGILLGTGGLVKAYQDSIKLGLSELEVTELEPFSLYGITLEHRQYNQFLRFAELSRAEVLNSEFAAGISLKVKVPKAEEQAFIGRLETLCKGSGGILKLDV
ncbi:MAG: YigZ family protein [Succinivibrio sp.]|nr:YigZ family protein [Succinivibrio sp.]